MTALDEMARYRGRHDRPEMIPHTAGAEDPDTSPEMLRGMIDKVLDVGYERRVELDKMVAKKGSALEHLRDGTYFIRYAHVGQYADFVERANHEYLKKKYPWLQDVSEGLGFDEDKTGDYDSFEAYLASIPHEDWEAWIEDMDTLEDYPSLDDDRASELEMEESGRWMAEDGGPDLIKAMVEEADDAYEAYLLSKVTNDLIWEWSRETDHYPENQGQGDVWMDMDKFAKEAETQEWFLDHLDDDVAGWLAQKKLAYEDKAGAMFDAQLHLMANEDEQVLHVYNRLDAEGIWQLFLQTFPDERREQDDPYWYWWKPQYNEPGTWRVGYKSDNHNLSDWKPGLQQALDDLLDKEWFWSLVKNWFSRGPEGHPEFKFEAKAAPPEAQPDPDDPEVWVKHYGGLQEEVVYEDDRIKVLYPRDYQTLNSHLLNAGLPQITEQNWRDLFKYKDIFIVQAKLPVDLLGRQDTRELAVIYGDTDVDLRVWTGSIKSPSIQEVMAHPEYGRSVRKMLMRFYRERLQRDTKAGHVLLQLGGGREIRRAERRGHLSRADLGVALGLYYVERHKYRLAAKAFNRPPNTLTATGVWLMFDAVEDLIPVFKNEDAATTVFAHDHYDWFDHYYDKGSRPKVSDVLPYLTPAAIKHIREVMVNRQVYFPDGQGEYVVLTPKVLAEYDDATILDWLANLSDEDEQDGVFDDIIEAIELAGVDILSSASQDSVYTGYVEAAVDAIDGREHKWTTHPTKKYKSGDAMEAFKVFVRWEAVKDWDEKYYNEHGQHYDGDLESLAVEANADSSDPDASNMEAGWHDVNKEWAGENLNRIFELTAPEPIPGSPGYHDPAQLDLPIKENEDEEVARLKREYGLGEPDYDMPKAEREADAQGFTQDRAKQVVRAYLAKLRKPPMREGVDDPDAPEMMPGAVEGFPPDFRRRVEAIIRDAYGYDVGPVEITVIPYFPPSDEEIDASDGRLHRMRNHQTVAIVYDPGQEAYSADNKAFKQIKGTVINTFRWLDVRDAYAAGPNPDEGDSPTKVQFWFTMYEKPQPVPAPAAGDEGEDVPF